MYFDLSTGNQTKLTVFSNKTSKWIDEAIAQHGWENYDPYENRLTLYAEHLFDPLTQQMDIELEEQEIWDTLTKGQKLFFNFLVFEEEVDNGGIFQFFWNTPEHVYAFKQAIEILQLDGIKEGYSTVLAKYETLADKLNELRAALGENDDEESKEFIHAFEKGLALFGEDEQVEDILYSEAYKLESHQAMCQYIEQHKAEFIKV
jgi:hypothetical protein